MGTSPSILLTYRLADSALEALRGVGEVVIEDARLEPSALREAVRGKSAVICMLTDRIDAALLDAAGPSLKIVANVAVGFDNIDVPAARARRVVITNTPDVLTNSTAELTWALILAVARRVGEAERYVRRGDWKGWSFEAFNGSELGGKQLGVVGAGRIGRAVAAKAAAFGMRAVFARRGAAATVDGCPVLPLDDLLASSDVVSLHLPLQTDTRHLIDRRALELMKSTAVLVNTARGAIVDEAALTWALGAGKIAGAGLDVFEHEPAVSPGLLALEHVVLLPHIGSATRETRVAMGALAVRNVVSVLSGEPALTPV